MMKADVTKIKSSIRLRDYQKASINAVLEAREKENISRPLIQLPTGTGKTVVFAALAKQLQAKTLIVAHRDELLRQAEDKVKMIWPGVTTGIIKAKENDYRDKDVVIASIQTISKKKRLKQIAAEGWNLCIIDEAHHGVSKSYRDTINFLGFMDDDPKRLLLGVTATTKRLDKLGLWNVFQKIVYESSIRTMVRAGYLSDIRGFRTNTEVDISTVKTNQGDFIERELSIAVNTPERNEKVVESYLEHAKRRKAIAFTAGIQHAHDLAEVFMKHRIEARALSGKTPADERKEILEAFSSGKIRIVCNCNVLTEGYDEPSISVVLLARPTKSSTLYTQMVGRGTRKCPGKKDCVVIDFQDNRHDVCALPSLLGLDINKMKNGESLLEEMEEKSGSPAINKSIGDLEEFDILDKSDFRWFFDGQQWRLPVGPGAYALLIPNDIKNKKFQATLIKKDEESVVLHSTLLSFEYGQGICEDFARRNSMSFSRKDAPWLSQPATEKQMNLLVKLGIVQDNMTKGKAADAISQFFAEQEVRRNNQCH